MIKNLDNIVIKKESYLEIARKIIKEVGCPLSEHEIWDYSVSHGYRETNAKTPWKSISAQIYVDIAKNDKSEFIKYDNPVKFFLKNIPVIDNKCIIEKSKTIQKNTTYTEKDLHPFLITYVSGNPKFGPLNYTKTIDHTSSKKSSFGTNIWSHPDIVGIFIPKYNPTVTRLQKLVFKSPIKFNSFELKVKLDRSNFKESYFQALSNSRWANKGYLVAATVDDDLYDELKRLNNLYGIGVIELDLENADASKILFESHEWDIDFDTMESLANINPVFESIIDISNTISQDLGTFVKTKNKFFDECKTSEELNLIAKEKGWIK
jgi:uncharacterized protein